jgi:hypothetical protein
MKAIFATILFGLAAVQAFPAVPAHERRDTFGMNPNAGCDGCAPGETPDGTPEHPSRREFLEVTSRDTFGVNPNAGCVGCAPAETPDGTPEHPS